MCSSDLLAVEEVSGARRAAHVPVARRRATAMKGIADFFGRFRRSARALLSVVDISSGRFELAVPNQVGCRSVWVQH